MQNKNPHMLRGGALRDLEERASLEMGSAEQLKQLNPAD